MIGRKSGFRVLLCLSTLVFTTSALGGGLYITEFGQPSMGASGAGWSVLAEDASTGVGNPAGIFQLDEQTQSF